ncbi:MAG: carboxypeptidase regulatory-like domain-containing protein [Melioribacteraceae bacterium]|nr:carboxypeptidase regulatory-like domain-containing protein [Melioribacteraceae bacterium]
MAACNNYPLFEKNQVLTSTQLNQLVKYSDQQDRITRAKLIGVGIVCGFEISYSAKAQTAIIISEGVGITSDGYLISSESSTLTHYKKYKDIGGYSLFGDKASQTVLYELLPSANPSENSDIQKLTMEFLKDKAIVLYLEIYEKDLKNCVGDDCNERGRSVEMCVKKLLIGYDDLRTIINKCAPSQTYAELEEKINSRYKLPDISIGRESDLINTYKYESYSDIKKLYLELIKSSTETIYQALLESYKRFKPILSGKYSTNPFKDFNLDKYIKKMIESQLYGIQYIYDYLKDIILAYNEFKEAAFDLSVECCYKEACFPRHLMLGEAIPSAACNNSVFRHTFIYSPIHNEQQHLLEKVKMLFDRLERIVNSFYMPTDTKGQIKITPSREKGTELSERAIPYYYKLESKDNLNNKIFLHHIWNYDLKRKCRPYLNQSYHSDLYSESNIPAYIKKPLKYDTDEYNFYRIEGHQGQSCDLIMKTILKKVENNNLPVKVIKLRLGKTPTEKEINLDCRFNDISMFYQTLSTEYLCFLRNKMKYFSELDFKDKTTAPELKTGSLKGTVTDKNGSALAGASVKLTSVTSSRASYSAVSNTKGIFTISNITAGNYTLLVSFSRYADYSISVKIEEGQTKNVKIPMEASATSPDIAMEFKERSDMNLTYGYDLISRSEGLLSNYSAEEVKYLMSAAVMEMGKPLTAMEEYEFSDSSVGRIYLEASESGSREVLSYLHENETELMNRLGTKSKDELITRYYQLLKLIQAIEELISVVPVSIISYSESAISAREKSLVSLAKEFRTQIYKNLENASYTRTGRESEIIIHLTELIEKCLSREFLKLFKIYQQRVAEILKFTLFGHFIKDHSGAAHMAGVMPGGTFIIVCDENGIVVADFTLPYICCSDCPPITYVMSPEQVVFKLPKTTFCFDDNSNYIFTAEPSGGIVSGNGVSQNATTKQYEFNPSKAATGLVKLKYVVNMNTYELMVDVIDVKPNFAYTVDNSDTSSEKRKVTFTAAPTDGDSYEWDFGDESDASSEKNPVHEYDLSEEHEFSVNLKVTKSGCSGSVTQKITLSYCTAEFEYVVDRVVDKLAVVTFKSTMGSDAVHLWKFGDNGESKEVNPIHKYSVSDKNSFDVIHSVATEDCKDEETSTIKINTCNSDFIVEYGSAEGNTITIYFSAKPADAKTYTWDFGDTTTSTQGPTTSHAYTLSSQAQTIKVKLTITSETCTDTITKEVSLPAYKPETQDISFTIGVDTVCKYNKTRYRFDTNVPGVVTGYGVVKEGEYYYFDPSDKKVQAGINKFTFTSVTGETAVLAVTILYPIAKFSVEKIVQPNPTVDSNTYQIFIKNNSTGATQFIWRINDKIVAREENPSIILDDSDPDTQYTLALTAISGECSQTIREIITIPQVADPVAGTTDNVTVVTYGDGSVVVGDVVVEDAIVNAFNKNLKTLSSLTTHNLFDTALSANVVAYKDTKSFLSSISTELANAETRRLYSSGAKNDEMTELFYSMTSATHKRIESYTSSAASSQRQFAYNLILIQLSELCNVLGLQKSDIKDDGSIINYFIYAEEILGNLKHMNVVLDQNKQLSTIINATIKVSANKPVLLTVMKRLSAILNA